MLAVRVVQGVRNFAQRSSLLQRADEPSARPARTEPDLAALKRLPEQELQRVEDDEHVDAFRECSRHRNEAAQRRRAHCDAQSAMPATASSALRMKPAVMETSVICIPSVVEVDDETDARQAAKRAAQAFIPGFGAAEASGKVVELRRPA